MITAENNVVCFGKAGGSQELLDREVRELYEFVVGVRSFMIDDGKKTGAGRQNRVYWILQTPILMKFRNWSCLEVECEQLSEFLYAKRAESHCDELKQAMRYFPFCFIDLPQGTLMSRRACLVTRPMHVVYEPE